MTSTPPPRLPESMAAAGRLPVLPPWQALAELAVMTTLIVGVDWALRSVDIADMQPNPFWIPILLLSLQYGTVSGMLAAGIAVLVTMLSGIPEQGVGENHFAYLFRVWAQPILWIAAAVFFGQFRMRQIAAKQELQRSVIGLASQRSALADYATNLRQRCDALERELAAVPAAPAHELLDALAALDGKGNLEAGLERLIGVVLPRAQASVYLADVGVLRRVASVGWTGDAPWRSELTRADALYAAVVENGRSLSVTERGDESQLGADGLAAVPLLSNDGTRCLGMLKLERAEPQQVDAALLPRLTVLATALARAIEGRAVATGQPIAAIAQQSRTVVAPQGRRQLRWLPASRAGEAAGGAAKKSTVV